MVGGFGFRPHLPVFQEIRQPVPPPGIVWLVADPGFFPFIQTGKDVDDAELLLAECFPGGLAAKKIVEGSQLIGLEGRRSGLAGQLLAQRRILGGGHQGIQELDALGPTNIIRSGADLAEHAVHPASVVLGRVHDLHVAGQPLETAPALAREPHQVVDVVEALRHLVALALVRAARPFFDVALVDESAQVGADLARRPAEHAFEVASRDRVPALRHPIEDASLLARERFDAVLEVGRAVVHEPLEIATRVAEGALAQQPVDGLDQARIPAGQDVKAPDPLGLLLENRQDRVVAAPLGEGAQHFKHLVAVEAAQNEGAKEVEERPLHLRDGAKIGRRTSGQHDAVILHEKGAQSMLLLVSRDRLKEVIEILDAEQQTAAAPIDFMETEIQGPLGDVLGGFAAQGIDGRRGPIGLGIESFGDDEPEVGQVSDAIELFRQHEGHPLAGELRVALDPVGEGEQGHRLPHTAGADEQNMLLRVTAPVVADDAKEPFEKVLPADELVEELIGIQAAGGEEVVAAHQAYLRIQ